MNKAVLNKYELIDPFQNKDAGFSRWTYAMKDGQVFFLKEFLDPIYPISQDISEELKKSRIVDCEEYENKKKRLYEAVNNASDGNLVRISEFFRCDSHYYISTLKIKAEKLSFTEIMQLSLEDKLLLCRTIAHTVMGLHEKHIVHADIKENNILIKKTTTGKLVAKLIDFDCSFFEDDPPKDEDGLGGDQVYLAPEACQFICGESVDLTCKIDVFALGLLFHQYFTGDLPEFDNNEYDYAYEAVLDEKELKIDDDIPEKYRNLIQSMLERDPKKRVDMETVFHNLFINEVAESDKCINKEIENLSTPGLDSVFHCAGDL